MKFPIINISIEKWHYEDLMEYVCYDEFIYTDKESVFEKYYKDKLFCDENGQIFKAIGKAEMTENWRNWLRFIPNVWKTKIVFKNMYKEMSVEELRTLLLERISELEEDDFTLQWKVDIENAKTHSELINDK